jgi:hypothetical protein
MKRSLWITCVAVVAAAACSDSTGPDIARPENLTYQLEPSGEPLEPMGIVLLWDAVTDPELEIYNVYSRAPGSSEFDLRGSTTSTTFHDVGPIDIEYFVTAVNRDGRESAESDVVFVDELLALERSSWIESTSLNGAVHLAWSDNPFQNEPEGFKHYRVYTTGFSIDDGLCGASWTLEGTTVSPEFLASALTNGVPRCFAVSAVSVEGWEGLWTDPPTADTPRPDARNVLVTRLGYNVALSGFRFFLDANGNGVADATELGIVTRGDVSDIDFRIVGDGAGGMIIEPVRPGTEVALYSTDPSDDLTAIDVAPVTGYSDLPITAEPGFGYVFQMSNGDGFARFGAMWVTHVGQDYIIFDWSYQTDPGNPELRIHGGRPTFDGGELIIRGVR